MYEIVNVIYGVVLNDDILARLIKAGRRPFEGALLSDWSRLRRRKGREPLRSFAKLKNSQAHQK